MADLEFITAPHIIPSENPEEQVGDEFYSDLVAILRLKPGPVRMVVLKAFSDL